MPLSLSSLPEMFGAGDRPVEIKGQRKPTKGSSEVILTGQGSRIDGHRKGAKRR